MSPCFLSKTVPFRATGSDQRWKKSENVSWWMPWNEQSHSISQNSDWTSPDCSRNATHSSEAHQVCGCRRRNVLQDRRDDGCWRMEDRSRLVSWNRKSQKSGGMPRGPLLFTSGTYPTQRGTYTDEAMRWWWRLVRVVSQNCWSDRWNDDSLVTHRRPYSRPAHSAVVYNLHVHYDIPNVSHSLNIWNTRVQYKWPTWPGQVQS